MKGRWTCRYVLEEATGRSRHGGPAVQGDGRHGGKRQGKVEVSCESIKALFRFHRAVAEEGAW